MTALDSGVVATLALLLLGAGCRCGGGRGDVPPEVVERLQQAAEQVARSRGGPPVVPEIAVVTPEQLQQLEASIRAEHLTLQAGHEALDCFVRAAGLATERAAFQAQLDRAYADATLVAVYDPTSRRILLTEAATHDDEYLDTVLQHEVVHALQDERHGILRRALRQPAVGDVGSVARLLVEGDAVYTTMHVTLGDEVDWVDDLLEVAPVQSLRSRRAPLERLVDASLLQAYSKGALAVQTLRRDGGWDAVDAALADPPVSSEQVMDPARADDPPRYVRLDLDGALPNDWRVHGAGTLGAYGTGNLLWALFARESPEVVLGWDGDRVRCAERPDGTAALVWRTVWDTAADASDFDITIRGWRVEGSTVVTERRGAEVLVLVGVPADRAADVAAAAWRGSWEEVPTRAALEAWLP